MNKTEHKLYFYSLNGTLLKRYEFSKLAEEYGNQRAVS